MEPEIETESTRRELAKDPKRKASRSNDPGWKYAYYPNPLANKDVVKCILCGNQNHEGMNRFKQHLIGGYPDIVKCPKTTTEIAKEMRDFVENKKKRSKKNVQVFEEEHSDDDVEEVPSTAASNTLQGSKSSAGSTGNKGKVAAQPFNFKRPTASSKSVASMYMKTPEQVVEERHAKGPSQTTLENRLRTPEEKERVHMHIANFFYECGIPFNAANSRSYEVMIESIGQYGPGLKPPTYHELRVPLLKKAKEETEKLKEKHEKAWKRYGCTLMSDGWTDRRGRSLINFLANSPEGTFFLGSVNASSESHDAQMLANLLETKIKEIGEKNVVQVVTDNGANYKLAGHILEIRMPTLFWTPCAAHCLDLMLEDIGKTPSFKKAIYQARRCTTFIYRHGRVLDAMREKTNGRDLVRTGATRFATAFLTLQSLQWHQQPLRYLFCGLDWTRSKLAKTENGRKVSDTVLSSVFWNSVDDCVNASLPLLQVLRIADGDERPALAEVAAAMDYAKEVFVLRDYARDTLALRWRSWMTTYYMERYLKNQTFYQIQSQSIIDNPDQRIVDDLSSFTGIALSFSLTLFNSAVDLISFSNILLGIYPPLFVILLVYSIGGTAISVFLGRGLVTLNFLQEKKEADFRYGLVRVRENAESIAFYGGEENELQLLLQRFRSAFENLTQLLISSRNLEFFTNGYRYLIQILPAAVVAPLYFAGKIDFGVINQSVSAFNHILGDFSLIVFQFQSISAFTAVIDRLGEFDDVLDNESSKSPEDSSKGIQLTYDNVKKSTVTEVNGSMPLDGNEKLLVIEKLTVQTPTKSVLVKDLSLQINEKDHLLVTGPSGSGKTSLLRAIAGLWSTGKGSIKFYGKNAEDSSIPLSSDSSPLKLTAPTNSSGNLERPNSSGVFFLPQRPYMVLGTLAQQLLYPTWTEELSCTPDTTKSAGSLPFLVRAAKVDSEKIKSQKPTIEELIQVLKDVRIEYILSRFSLDSTCEWSSVLSLGEQQRLAFARLLLSKPYLVLLDESTSALDEANEEHLYKQIEAAGITYISVGHRTSLYKHHNKRLRISTADPDSEQQNWSIESVIEETVPSTTNL